MQHSGKICVRIFMHICLPPESNFDYGLNLEDEPSPPNRYCANSWSLVIWLGCISISVENLLAI